MDIYEQVAKMNGVSKKTVEVIVKHVFKHLKNSMSSSIKPFRLLGLGTFRPSPSKICACHNKPVKFIGKGIARCTISKQVCKTVAQQKLEDKIKRSKADDK